jgi:hypothetical protein
MGKLAAWGAVAGAGKGMQANIEAKQKKELMNLDEARTMRILQMQQEFQDKQRQSGQAHAKEMQGTQIGAQKEMQESGFGHDEKMQGVQQDFQQEMQGGEQEWKSGENEKDRATTLEAARIRENAAAAKSKKDRWSFSKMKETRPMGEGGIPSEFEVPILRDGDTGRQYIQRGDRFMLPETEPASLKRAARSEVKKVVEGQLDPDVFLNAYKYLPIEAFRALGISGAAQPNSED